MRKHTKQKMRVGCRVGLLLGGSLGLSKWVNNKDN